MIRINYKSIVLMLVITFAVFYVENVAAKDDVRRKQVIKWAVQKTSTLRINGKTNVAGFGCDVKGYYEQDTIFYAKDDNLNKVIPLKGALNIDVNNFDCHNRLLTNDLRKTLKAKDYPHLVIRFVSLHRMPMLGNDKDVVKGWVDVELAGVCKRFELCYKIEKKGSVILLNGARAFNFSDFKLVPPQKLGGIVKVHDDFNVDFKLVLNEVL